VHFAVSVKNSLDFFTFNPKVLCPDFQPMSLSIFRKYKPIPEQQLREYNRCRPTGARPVLCYAPFRAMFLNPDGRVITCSYQRNHVLGVYPEQSLKEIWTGRPLKKLRKHIQNNDLSLGCYVCKNYFDAGRYNGIRASMYDELPGDGNYPAVIEFNLENFCNLECIMCTGELSSQVRKNREKRDPMPSPWDESLLLQLEEFIPHLTEAKFYGGEPFLIPIYFEIWEKIIRANPSCRISIQTNGTVWNHRVENLLAKANVHINVSLDAVTPDVYEHIRKGAVFNDVYRNIIRFREYAATRERFFGITAQIMQHNWKELPLLTDFCNQLDVPVFFGTVWYPLNASIWNLNSRKLKEIIDYLTAAEVKSAGKFGERNIAHYAEMMKQVGSWQKRAERREEMMLELNKEPPQILIEKIMKGFSENAGIHSAGKKIKKQVVETSRLRLTEAISPYALNANYKNGLVFLAAMDQQQLASWLEGEDVFTLREIFLAAADYGKEEF
jgi:MoaA/NifB/PqqE/SkfB family radical SAM enzyme